MTEFAPRSAVITGGASGIGLALAKRLAGQGVQVMGVRHPEGALTRVHAKAIHRHLG